MSGPAALLGVSIAFPLRRWSPRGAKSRAGLPPPRSVRLTARSATTTGPYAGENRGAWDVGAPRTRPWSSGPPTAAEGPTRSAQAEVGQVERRSVLQARRLDRRPRSPVDDDGARHDLGPGLLQRLHRGQRAATGGRDVLDHEHRPAGHLGALDAPLHAVGLGL